jgi:tetratricopeptide (TPR) repeat protein
VPRRARRDGAHVKPASRAQALTARGFARAMQRDFTGAIADLDAALRENPNLAAAYYYRGPAAIPQAAQLPPGQCSANDITHQERIAGCTSAIESDKLSGWTLKTAYCNRGYALTELGEYDRVIADSNALISVDPKAACAYLNRGRAWYYKNDLERAIADHTHTITLDPTFHEAHANRAAAYHRQLDFARAVADYDVAIKINPDIAMYHKDRANSLYYMQEYARANADLARAIELDPTDVELYYRRGNNYTGLGEFDRAIADFTRQSSSPPTSRASCTHA